MTVGEGIFFGLVVASLVVLYIATKDRWRWRRIAAGAAALVAVPLLSAAGWEAWTRHEDSRPRVQAEFWGLQPGMAMSEVVFRKGQPVQKADDFSVYWPSSPDRVGYVVGQKDQKLRFVVAVVKDGDAVFLPTMQGISHSSSTADLKAKFGEPDSVSVFEDGSRRHLSFNRFGVTFQLEKDRVISLGVFDPKLGPPRFGREQSTPEPPSAGASRR